MISPSPLLNYARRFHPPPPPPSFFPPPPGGGGGGLELIERCLVDIIYYIYKIIHSVGGLFYERERERERDKTPNWLARNITYILINRSRGQKSHDLLLSITRLFFFFFFFFLGHFIQPPSPPSSEVLSVPPPQPINQSNTKCYVCTVHTQRRKNWVCH